MYVSRVSMYKILKGFKHCNNDFAKFKFKHIQYYCYLFELRNLREFSY